MIGPPGRSLAGGWGPGKLPRTLPGLLRPASRGLGIRPEIRRTRPWRNPAGSGRGEYDEALDASGGEGDLAGRDPSLAAFCSDEDYPAVPLKVPPIYKYRLLSYF